MFQALADPTRWAMIERLSRGPASVSQLAEPFPFTLAAVVQHLQVLEQSGVVRTEKVGRVRTCRLEKSGLAAAERWITQRRAAWERRLDRLGDLLAEKEEGCSLADIAAPLEREEHGTKRGGCWAKSTVLRIARRAEAASASVNDTSTITRPPMPSS